MAKSGFRMSPKDFARNMELATQKMKEKVNGTHRVYDFDFRLRTFLEISGITLTGAKFKAMHNLYMKTFYSNIRLYREAIGTLKFLGDSGYKLGLVIDGNPEIETKIISKFGLARYFDSIIISEAIGHAKITGIPLKTCIKELGIPSSSILVVGDRIDKDIRPANILGAIPVRLVRQRGRYSKERPKGAADKPRHTIKALTELRKFL